ncbi:MAG: tRNA-specific 2-thiouridylase MnmA [candidate division TM6 bacterium GW2011_GWF2_32_72]|nr:MAG: tRNA-specific 2-thiouridylase MnmA [candidate division TM6 bacterium GW2011_GWF2_32_72]
MKIAVLVSGGVDSSVALRLLKDQGHDLTAFYLKIWLEDELSFLGECPWEEDLSYAKAVCEQAGVPLEVISLQKEYWDRVVSYTISEVKAGRTPNPDILCNQRVKFGAFFDKISPEFEKVATGHYARVEEKDGRYLLKMTPDPIKDQTYFLSHLSQAQLSKALFPLGEYNKGQVRELAQRFDLPNKVRKDSQGICFLGKLKFDEFLKYHLGELPGDIIEFETGKKLKEHAGFWYYTIGQRRGSGLGGGPWYVVAKDPEKNVVYMSKNYFSKDKFRDEFVVSGFNWISQKPKTGEQLQVKLRHGAQIYNCKLDFLSEDRALVKIDEQDQGIASGQFAVFYKGDECVGSGVIDESLNGGK